MKIYRSPWHIIATGLVLAAPFVFLLFFSKIIHIPASQLFGDVTISFWRLAAAYLISVIVAWALAVGFYTGRRADVALPFFDVLQSFPTSAALPVATFYWGASNFSVIFFLSIAIIWPILFSIISSLKLIKHDWEEAAEIMGLRGVNYLRYFLWPMSVPSLITGSIIGLGDGWEALVATEIIIGVKGGLGRFFQFFANNPEITIFGILGVLVIVFSINKLIWLPLLEWSHEKVSE